MFKIFTEIIENVSTACRRSKDTFKRGFRQGAMRAYAEAQKAELIKATPRSDRTTEHAGDAWEIDYEYSGMFISGFEITNPHERIDWVEYGTERPKKTLTASQAKGGKQGDRIYPKYARALHFIWNGKEVFAKSVRGSKIEPMGFVREVQDKMNREIPAWARKAFDAPIEKHWT